MIPGGRYVFLFAIESACPGKNGSGYVKAVPLLDIDFKKVFFPMFYARGGFIWEIVSIFSRKFLRHVIVLIVVNLVCM